MFRDDCNSNAGLWSLELGILAKLMLEGPVGQPREAVDDAPLTTTCSRKRKHGTQASVNLSGANKTN